MTKRDYAPKSEWKNWNWRSEGDIFQNGAFFVESGKKVTKFPKTDIKAQPGDAVGTLTKDVGPIKCIVNKPC